jgi:hypothetical protein
MAHFVQLVVLRPRHYAPLVLVFPQALFLCNPVPLDMTCCYVPKQEIAGRQWLWIFA